MSSDPGQDDFEAFFRDAEPRLRVALIAVFGQETGRDATAAALVYAWEHWDRVSGMDNPAGYLYRVGRSSQRRRKDPVWMPVPASGRSSQRRRKEPVWMPVPASTPLMVEPGLPKALGSLTEKQRTAVVLVHAYGWKRQEVADLTGMSTSSLDTHLSRGLRRLRNSLGVEINA
jgi:RNA polymerase sigma-70 factor (ECF subfamily)